MQVKAVAMGSSTMPMLNKTDFEKIQVVKPSSEILQKFMIILKPINELNINYSIENQKLTHLKDLLLSKMTKVL